jgi:sugar diacid utilization regulator
VSVSKLRRTVAVEDDLGGFYVEVVGAFQEVALLTTAESVALDDVLRLAGQRLCELLDATRCSVYLRRDDGRFQGQVGYCVGRSIDAGVSRLVSGGEGDRFTAEIVESRSPVVVRDAVHDPRTIQRTMRRWGVQTMLGVPLVVEGEVIGIIYVDDQGVTREFTERDIKLAQAFAGLSALAVRQGWLYKQLAERAKTIDYQRRVLGDTTVVHSRVTRAVLDGADIEAILSLIVELLGKPVVLYTPSLEVTSWVAPEGLGLTRSPGLTAAQLSLPWVRKTIATLHNGSPSAMLRATPDTRCRRLLVRMAVDGQCAGFLELCEIGRSFSPVDSNALEQASMAVALKLLADQRNADLHRQEREEFFSDILYGRRDYESLNARAANFGVDVDSRHVVLRLQYATETDSDASTGQARRQEVMSLLSRHVGEDVRPVACTSLPGADLLLLDVPVTESASPDGALGEALRAAFPELVQRFAIRFAIASDACRKLRDLPALAEHVRETAALLRETAGQPRLVFVRELELLRLLARREGIRGAQRHAQELLRPLCEHDEANGGALLPTLKVFAQCHGQVRATAAVLDVHENTVRYRLNRIREVSSVEPERLDSLLTVVIALQVETLFGAL